jgi:hypothetical protein
MGATDIPSNLVDTPANLLAAQKEALALLPPDLRKFAPDVDQQIGKYVTRALPYDVNQISQYVVSADVFMRDPAKSITDVAISYVQTVVAEAIATVVIQVLGAALGTAVCPGLGSAAGEAIGKALGDIVNSLTSKLIDPYVERDGGWIPEVEEVLDRWIQPFGDPNRTSNNREIRNAHDFQDHNPRRWPKGTPYRKVIGDILHDMSRWHHSDPINWYEVGTAGGLPVAINFQDDDHYHWDPDWWVNPKLMDPHDGKPPTWQGRFHRELDNAVQSSVQRRASEASARAQLTHLTLQAYAHRKAHAPVATSINRSVLGAVTPPPLRPVAFTLHPAVLSALTAPAPPRPLETDAEVKARLERARVAALETFAATWTVARLPEFVAFYLGGGRGPAPRAA